MHRNRKRLNHPLASYLVGGFFIMLLLVVFAGVIHHLTVSPRGPGLLRASLEKQPEEERSVILEMAQQTEEFEKHRHFHSIVKPPTIPENKRPVCFICHSDFPHRTNKKVRALLNIHTQFLFCETCHIRNKPGKRIVYQWYNPLSEEPQGPFYGTGYQPGTDMLMKGDGGLSKIAPYYALETNGKLTLAVLEQDAPLARDYMKVRDKLRPEQREGLKNKFHGDIKPRNFECRQCHSHQGILDFKRLGFSDTRTANLLSLEVVGILDKYEQFHMPKLFEQ